MKQSPVLLQLHGTSSGKLCILAPAEEGPPSPSYTNSFSSILPSQTEREGIPRRAQLGGERICVLQPVKCHLLLWVAERRGVDGQLAETTSAP